jgi:hypothetical protein
VAALAKGTKGEGLNYKGIVYLPDLPLSEGEKQKLGLQTHPVPINMAWSLAGLGWTGVNQ